MKLLLEISDLLPHEGNATKAALNRSRSLGLWYQQAELSHFFKLLKKPGCKVLGIPRSCSHQLEPIKSSPSPHPPNKKTINLFVLFERIHSFSPSLIKRERIFSSSSRRRSTGIIVNDLNKSTSSMCHCERSEAIS